MAASRVTESASESLLARKAEIARAVTEALYTEMPELMEKYGETGRRKCLQDMHYNLEHLAPAVALGEPVLFARYVVWLREMLASRGVPADEVRRSLELTAEAVRARLPAEEAIPVVDALAAGLRELEEPGAS
jgi:hypothetical protein